MDKRRKRVTKAEWVATMALIAELDRDVYRGLRKEAWENVRFDICSTNSN